MALHLACEEKGEVMTSSVLGWENSGAVDGAGRKGLAAKVMNSVLDNFQMPRRHSSTRASSNRKHYVAVNCTGQGFKHFTCVN